MNKTNKNNSRLPKAKGTEMATVYMPKECARKVRHMVLNECNQRIIDEFMMILDMKEKFIEQDVPMPNKLVMSGPPGTGKTLTAFYIAERLQLPLVLVRLDTIIHSHLGETASNIRKIFDFARLSPCVLFLDEFDAIARTRDNNDEVKEMSRVVNTLLQCMDEFEGESILVAATNLADELDHAVWRRFDTKMDYAMPSDQDRQHYIQLLIGSFATIGTLEHPASTLLSGCSFADIEQIVLKAKRKAIIEDSALTLHQLQTAYEEYKPKVHAYV